MHYMIVLRYTQQHREEALQYFWQHGATHYEGKVTLKHAWVATQDRIAYALVDAAQPDEIAKACEPLRDFGELEYRAVTDVEEL